MKKKIYLIHHSHTDIGYTHPSEVLKVYHRDFINQAIEAFENEKNSDFRWTCENYWQVENYLETASEQKKEKLIDLMKDEKIDFSVNYLNMTELIDMDVYEEKIKEACEFSNRYALNFNAAMSADINGYSQKYVEALAKNGVKYNFSCIHTHHGAHAFGKKPYIFNWETKHGIVKTVLTAHYHIGNELFLMPEAGVSYLMAENGLGIDSDNKGLKITKERVDNFLKEIKEVEEYEYDFVPMMISGINTDNGTPNPDVLKTINTWNQYYGNEVEIKLVTLNEFFKEVEEPLEYIPTHSGDMNDWWGDGVGSTPKGTKLFKSAQRKYAMLKQIDPGYKNESALRNLIMYAEHTWGHSASVSNPYNTLVDEMMLKKQSYVANADMQINEDLENHLLSKEQVTILPSRPKIFTVTNVLDFEITTTAVIIIEHWETVDGFTVDKITNDIIILDAKGNKYKSQVRQCDRGHEIEFECSLKALESKSVEVKMKSDSNIFSKFETCDKANDFSNKKCTDYLTNKIETENFILDLNLEKERITIYDKNNNCFLSDSNDFLKLVVTSLESKDQMRTRKAMGRNRISPMGNRYFGENLKFELIDSGDVYITVRVHQEIHGMVEAFIDIKVYKNIQKIEVVVNYLKQTSKNIENIYLNFNITSENGETLLLTKCGDMLDVTKNLLPEANNMFFICGEELLTDNYKILSPDCSLITFDNGNYEPVDLNKRVDKSKLTFWLANNFWETNFFNDLSGYHSFRFILTNEESENSKFSFENPLVHSSNILEEGE